MEFPHRLGLRTTNLLSEHMYGVLIWGRKGVRHPIPPDLWGGCCYSDVWAPGTKWPIDITLLVTISDLAPEE